MIHGKNTKLTPRERRARRVRKKVFGTSDAPRLSVHRTLKNMYVQIIDDEKGVSIVGISSEAPEFKGIKVEGGKVGIAKVVGKAIAEKAKEKGVTKVVFDRAGYLYHGRVKAVAEGAREGGLVF